MPLERQTMLKRIALTGPECTGKSWLARNLASHFNTNWVPEYSVEYLTKKGTDYSPEDILNIAKGQLELENSMAQNAETVLFCDTDILVNKIWCMVVFNRVDKWIELMFREHRYDLYLLCYPDIKWENGLFRENPGNREGLFELYEKELKKQSLPYKIIKGEGDQRFQNAVNFVDAVL